MERRDSLAGFGFAVTAFTLWGFTPIYFKLLGAVPVLEIFSHRVLWTVVCLILIMLFGRRMQAIGTLLKDRRSRNYLLVTSVMIGLNWLVLVWAVHNDQILATSLAYYINPLINILFGRMFFDERPNRFQAVAILLALAGVVSLFFGALDTLWISLLLGLNFSVYGMLRKRVNADELASLSIETLVLLPPSLALALWYFIAVPGPGFGADLRIDALLFVAAVGVSIPLLLFSAAVRRMSYSALGFTQFITPTMTFILGTFIYDEPFEGVRIIAFALIWTGALIFGWDSWRNWQRSASERRSRPAVPPAG